MKVFYLADQHHNAGDMLSQPILEWLGVNYEPVHRKYQGKLLAVGSILTALRANDVVWGSGLIRRERRVAPPNTTFLAVRGPLTRQLIVNAEIPEVYGDPALLLPLLYSPNVQKKYKVGIVPHYADKNFVDSTNAHLIDIQAPWRAVVDEIVSCESIISSSLHGIIFAEAYGIPAQWAVYGDRVIGGDFKFQDYFTGTGRATQKPFTRIMPIDIATLSQIQHSLKTTLLTYLHEHPEN